GRVVGSCVRGAHDREGALAEAHADRGLLPLLQPAADLAEQLEQKRRRLAVGAERDEPLVAVAGESGAEALERRLQRLGICVRRRFEMDLLVRMHLAALLTRREPRKRTIQHHACRRARAAYIQTWRARRCNIQRRLRRRGQTRTAGASVFAFPRVRSVNPLKWRVARLPGGAES